MAKAREDLVLVRINTARTALMSVRTVDDARQVIALADGARVYAKRIKASQVTNYAGEIILRGKRLLGELLQATPKNTGAKGRPGGGTRGSKKEPRVDVPPTLSESGIDKKLSSEAQQLAAAPPAEFEAELAKAGEGDLNPNRVIRELKNREQKKKRNKKRLDAAKSVPQLDTRILIGDFRDHADKIADGSLSLIFTDPPYDRKALKLFPGLGEFAADKLAEGGSLVCYIGHIQIFEALQALREKLRFWWICACVHSGPAALMREYGIRAHWKPMLWFVKGTRDDKSNIVQDVVTKRYVMVRSFGVFTLRFSSTSPMDSERIWWKNHEIKVATLVKLMRFELDPDTLRPMDLRIHQRQKKKHPSLFS